MRKQFESYTNVNEDPQANQINEIDTFSKKHNISSKELFDAYEIALCCSPEEIVSKEPIRKEVKNLAKMMDDFIKEGLALNRIVKLIDSKNQYESACRDYYAMVDSMQINDKGKKMLYSIVEKKRPGTIIINDAQTSEEIDGFGIPENVAKDEYSQNDLALELMRRLSRYKDKKIEIIFS